MKVKITKTFRDKYRPDEDLETESIEAYPDSYTLSDILRLQAGIIQSYKTLHKILIEVMEDKDEIQT